MFIKKLLFHDENIKNISINDNILTSNSKNKIIYYNIQRNKVFKIIHTENEKYVENNKYVYSINNGSTVSKTDGQTYKKIAYLGSKISHIENYNSNVYFGSENGCIYKLENDILEKVVSHTKYRLTYFYIVNFYIYIGYSDGSIIIFHNGEKRKSILSKKHFDSIIFIAHHNNNVYCLHKNGVIKIINNLNHVGNISLFSENVILKTCYSNLLLYSNSTISIIKNEYSKKIFQPNKEINDFICKNNIMYIASDNKIYVYLLELTKKNYYLLPNHIKEYIYCVHKFCNKYLVNDLMIKIINIICHTYSVQYP